MNPETQSAPPLESENETPDTRIENTHKANLMALTEDKMREGAIGLEAQAARNTTIFEETGDTVRENAAKGYVQQAENHRAAIDSVTEEIGSNFEEVTEIFDGINARVSEEKFGDTKEQHEHRAKVAEHIGKALTRAGVIGSAEFTTDSNGYRFERDKDVGQARGHARNTHR